MTHHSTPRPCSATNKDGRPCQAHAIHDTDPPLCAIHSHRNHGGGAPRGNQNHLIHGFYSRILRRDERADLPRHPNAANLKDEIALTRAPLSPKSWFLAGEKDKQVVHLLETKRPAAAPLQLRVDRLHQRGIPVPG